MKRQLAWGVLGVLAFVGMGIWAQEPAGKKEPMTFSLECAGGDCALLKGAPQTAGMRGGSVRLKPGESVGWHTTGQNEEALSPFALHLERPDSLQTNRENHLCHTCHAVKGGQSHLMHKRC